MGFLSKLGFDRHHRIERFGVLFLALALCMCVTLGFCVKAWRDHDTISMTNKAVYTTSFAFSKTGVTGSVVDVFRSKDKTRAFLLLKFEDTGSMSVNAKDYNMYLTGSDVYQHFADLESRPTGMIYFFGSTGYAGVYLVEQRGFPLQIVNLVLRDNSLHGDGDANPSAGKKEDDASFAEFNQARIFFNPGGDAATYASCLDSEKLSPFDMYRSMIALSQEKQLRDGFQTSLKQMSEQLETIAEFSNRLEMDGLRVPETPMEIAGDKITEPDENGFYDLETDYVIPGGFDVDWQHLNMTDSYFTGLYDGTDYKAYLQQVENDAEDETFSVTDIDVYYENGSKFVYSEDDDLSIAVGNDVTRLKTAWQNYYTTKRAYQCDQMRQLLTLEANARTAWTLHTVNDSDDVLTLY